VESGSDQIEQGRAHGPLHYTKKSGAGSLRPRWQVWV